MKKIKKVVAAVKKVEHEPVLILVNSFCLV